MIIMLCVRIFFVVFQVAGGHADTGHDAILPLFDETGAMVLENYASHYLNFTKVTTRPLTLSGLQDSNTQAFARARGFTPHLAPQRPSRLHISDSVACLAGIP